MGKWISAAVFVSVFVSAAAAQAPGPSCDPIGSAEMEQSGAIVLDLVTREGGLTGHARLRYEPSHPRFAEIVEHVGRLSPGETAVVCPWPDPSEEPEGE